MSNWFRQGYKEDRDWSVSISVVNNDYCDDHSVCTQLAYPEALAFYNKIMIEYHDSKKTILLEGREGNSKWNIVKDKIISINLSQN